MQLWAPAQTMWAQRSWQINVCWVLARDIHSSPASVVRASFPQASQTCRTRAQISSMARKKKKKFRVLGFHYSASSGDFPQTAELTVLKVKNFKKGSAQDWRVECVGVEKSRGLRKGMMWAALGNCRRAHSPQMRGSCWKAREENAALWQMPCGPVGQPLSWVLHACASWLWRPHA